MPYAGYQAGVEGCCTVCIRSAAGRSTRSWTAVDQTPFVQRYNAMADVVIDSRLAGRMPPEHRSQVRLQLSQPLKEELGGAHCLHGGDGAPGPAGRPRGREDRNQGGAAAWRAGAAATVEQHYRQYGEAPAADADVPPEQTALVRAHRGTLRALCPPYSWRPRTTPSPRRFRGQLVPSAPLGAAGGSVCPAGLRRQRRRARPQWPGAVGGRTGLVRMAERPGRRPSDEE